MKRGYNYPEKGAMERIIEGITALMILFAVCVVGSMFSGLLFGLFLRMFYFALNFKW